MPGIASVATGVVINYVAWATKTIRVGAGGIMSTNWLPRSATTYALLLGDRAKAALGGRDRDRERHVRKTGIILAGLLRHGLRGNWFAAHESPKEAPQRHRSL